MKEQTLLDYWLVLYRRRWLIVFVMCVAMVTSGVLSAILPPVFQAKATCFVPRMPDTASYLIPSGDGRPVGTALMPEPSEQTNSPYMGILKSKGIAELVHKEFPQKTVVQLWKDVDFSLTNEFLIEIYARDRDPLVAARIANAYVKHLNELLAGYSVSLNVRNQLTIEKAMVDAKDKLRKSTLALQEFRTANGAFALDEERRQLTALKGDFLSKQESAKVHQQENEMKISTLKMQLEKEAALYVSSELVIGSPHLQNLRRELSDVEIKLAGLKVDYRESHPQYAALRNQYDQVMRSINSEIERLAKTQIRHPDTSYEVMRRELVSLYVEREKVQATLRAYPKVFDNIDAKVKRITELLTTLDGLLKDVHKYDKMVSSLEMNLEEAKLQNKRELQLVVPVEDAMPPTSPSFPVPWLNVPIAGIAGFICGILYALLINYLECTKSQRIYRLLKAMEASKGN